MLHTSRVTQRIDYANSDLLEKPWDYPGQLPAYSGLLAGDSYKRLTPKKQRRLGQARVEKRTGKSDCLNHVLLTSNVAPVDSRHLVVSIGSNASPAVMRRKLRQQGVNGTIAFIQANVSGLRVGHSAHVSRPGYIPAAPVREPSATTPAVVSLLDAEQLACLDATEPNYTRTMLTAEVCQLELEGGERPASFFLYVSKHGVLAPPGQEPLGLMSQPDVFERLHSEFEPAASLFRDSDTRSVMSRLSRDEALRNELLASFARSGWATQSGFERYVSTAEPLRYGATQSMWADVPAVSGTFTCLPSGNSTERQGEQCVVIHPEDAQSLGLLSHVGVTGLNSPLNAPVPARLVHDPAQPKSTAGLDQIVRNALGIEVQESVSLVPIQVHRNAVADVLLSRPHFSMVRVQSADLSIVEQNVGLLSPLAMNLLGIQSGDEVVVQGAPGPNGVVSDVRMRMFTAPEETERMRESLSGGGLAARFPSANDALGVYPDLPWLFLDSAARAKLRVDDEKLCAVRVRASRRFQLIREFRELLLVLVLTFIGLVLVVESQVLRVVFLTFMLVAALGVIRSRLKHRLESQE